ncbi:MAG: class I SAM-dependent methyltransferase [Candidatus Bathyarchaeia archaeon]
MDFEEYMEKLDLNKLFEALGASDPKLLAKEVEYFTVEEAERRDEMLIKYFGADGISQIVNRTVKLLFDPPRPSAGAKVLDVGAGTGFFTAKIAEEVHAKLPQVTFYAMDATPSMLLTLARKHASLKPFVGLAENIEGSIAEARRFFDVPEKFDAVLSTLMLHHIVEPAKVFQSIRRVLRGNGKAVIVDLCDHRFEEFKTKMGDVHLGFKPENIHEMASKAFPKVRVERIDGIVCECSGRRVDVFFAYMYGV